MEGDGHDAFAAVSSSEFVRKEDVTLLVDQRRVASRSDGGVRTVLLWPYSLAEPSFLRSSSDSVPGVIVDHRIPSGAPI